MKRTLSTLVLLLLCCAPLMAQSPRFARVDGRELIAPDGKPLLLQGINLGNWLNPEGYMFLFKDANSYRLIDQALKELVGPDYTARFWRQFQDDYITRDDIRYIRRTGMNSVRIPFHYKLFTSEDFMGSNDPDRGFELLDRVIGWCKDEGLYVVLDMHCAPGGQTGDNIDDSYGYPWLFESDNHRQQFNAIWQRIARHYADEPTIVGYDLLNEPIAHYFVQQDSSLNNHLEKVYIEATRAIREVDRNHPIIWGGAQWNTNFDVFTRPDFDDNLFFECHTYWSDTTQAAIQRYLDFREKSNRPMYMGETGENTDQWVGAFRRLLEKHRIGWHFWPYKKMKATSCMVSIPEPEGWAAIVEYTQKDRSSYAKIREHRPSQQLVQRALEQLLSNLRFKNCIPNPGYIEGLGGVEPLDFGTRR